MNKRPQTPDPESRPGTGALCPEAQADGVPCLERGRECDTCEKAVAGTEPDRKAS
jgi:hypothetical protein